MKKDTVNLGDGLRYIKGWDEEEKRVYAAWNRSSLKEKGISYYKWEREHIKEVELIEKGIYPIHLNDKKIKLARTTKGIGGSERGPKGRNRGPKVKKELKTLKPGFQEKFPFELLEEISPDKKFDYIYNIEFKNILYGSNEIIYRKYITRYNSQKENGELDRINLIFQKISSVISKTGPKKNDIWYDGITPILLAIIIKNYVERDEIIADDSYYFSDKYIKNNTESIMYYVWLFKQVFSFKNHYCNLEDGNISVEWYAYGKLIRRKSDKGFRQKGQIYSDLNEYCVKNKIKIYEGDICSGINR